MQLNEFFKDRSFNFDKSADDLEEKINQEEIDQLEEKIFYYALDDDEIHKKYFIPLAREISSKIKNNSLDVSVYAKKFMPLVNMACVKYHKKNKIQKDIHDLFPKKIRIKLCHKLLDKSVDDIKNQEYKLESMSQNKTRMLKESLSLESDRNFEFVSEFNHRKLYVTRAKYQNKYFIAASANIRTGEAEFKEPGSSKEEAIKKLKLKIQNIESSIQRAPNRSGIDFNVEFSEQLLKPTDDLIYVKIVSGPKLVIAGPTMLEMPELLKGEGFRKAVNRHAGSLYNFMGATAVNGISELAANGRYIIGPGSEDADGNMVYPLYFDSIVQDTKEKIRLRDPALTVNSPRISENTGDTIPLSEHYERKLHELIKILEQRQV
jgi:hypothetical protein